MNEDLARLCTLDGLVGGGRTPLNSHPEEEMLPCLPGVHKAG